MCLVKMHRARETSHIGSFVPQIRQQSGLNQDKSRCCGLSRHRLWMAADQAFMPSVVGCQGAHSQSPGIRSVGVLSEVLIVMPSACHGNNFRAPEDNFMTAVVMLTFILWLKQFLQASPLFVDILFCRNVLSDRSYLEAM